MERETLRETTQDLRKLATATGRWAGAAALYVPTVALNGALGLAERLSERAHQAAERAREAGHRTVDALDAEAHHAPPYEERTVEALRELASERDIPGRSTMSKDELIAALRA